LSIRIKDLPPKAGKVGTTTEIATEDINDETSKTRKVSLADVTPYTWAASDEDAPLSTGILYITEAAAVLRDIKDVFLSLKNAPTGNTIEVDVLKETGVNTNVFATIFSTLPTIMINEFTSQTSLPVPVITDGVWQQGRRLQIKLTINDSNFIVSGLKVTIKS